MRYASINSGKRAEWDGPYGPFKINVYHTDRDKLPRLFDDLSAIARQEGITWHNLEGVNIWKAQNGESGDEWFEASMIWHTYE